MLFPLSPTLTLNPLTPTFPPGDVTMEGDTTVTEGPTYEDKLKFVSVIAKPMASKKLTKKIYKVCEHLSPGLWELVHSRDPAPRVIVIPGGGASIVLVFTLVPD